MQVVGLFSGIGGLELGLRQAGHNITLLCEKDPYCRKVLESNFADVPINTDVATLKVLPPGTELLAAGFPCTDVSRMGKRAGLGNETVLCTHIFRLLKTAVEDHRPVQWVLLENVEGILDRHGTSPPVIDYVVKELIKVGYRSIAYRILSISGITGVPNRRRRVFILASWTGDASDVLLTLNPRCFGGCKNAFHGHECSSCYFKALGEIEEDVMDNLGFAIDLANAGNPSSYAIETTPTLLSSNNQIVIVLPDDSVGMLRIEDQERLMGFEEGYTEPMSQPILAQVRTKKKKKRPKLLIPIPQEDDGERRRHIALAMSAPVGYGIFLGQRLLEPYNHKFQHSPDHKLMNHLVFGTAAKKPKPLYVPNDTTDVGTLQPLHWRAAGGRHSENEDENSDEDNDDPLTSQYAEDNVKTAEGAYRRLAKQGAIIAQAKIGTLADRKRYKVKIDYELESWPRCFYYVHNLGAFAVDGMSDTPVLAQFIPLSQFITKLGRDVTIDEISTCANRMREHGISLCPRLHRLFVSLGEFGVGCIERIPGVISDADLIGTVYWGYFHGVRWPVEMFDFLNLPLAIRPPQKAVELLTAAQRRASLPDYTCIVPPEPPQSIDADSMDVLQLEECTQPKGEEKAKDNNATDYNNQEDQEESDPTNCNRPLCNPAAAFSDRKVLVTALPSGGPHCEWVSPSDLLPFDCEASVPVRELKSQLKNSVLETLFDMALEDARMLCRLKSGQVPGGESGRAVQRRRALTAAQTATDLKGKCGKCTTCLEQDKNQKAACLQQRQISMALAGHIGAALSICHELAVGAKVSVWWHGDHTYYTGTVAFYLEKTTEHGILYDDGEFDVHALWKPSERIRVLNPVEEWSTHAQDLNRKVRTALEHKKIKERYSVLLEAQLMIKGDDHGTMNSKQDVQVQGEEAAISLSPPLAVCNNEAAALTPSSPMSQPTCAETTPPRQEQNINPSSPLSPPLSVQQHTHNLLRSYFHEGPGSDPNPPLPPHWTMPVCAECGTLVYPGEMMMVCEGCHRFCCHARCVSLSDYIIGAPWYCCGKCELSHSKQPDFKKDDVDNVVVPVEVVMDVNKGAEKEVLCSGDCATSHANEVVNNLVGTEVVEEKNDMEIDIDVIIAPSD